MQERDPRRDVYDSRGNRSVRAIRLMGAYRGRVVEGTNEGPLRGLAMIIPQQPAKSIATLDLTVSLADFFAGLDDLVAETLVVSFAVIMEQEFLNCFAERMPSGQKSRTRHKLFENVVSSVLLSDILRGRRDCDSPGNGSARAIRLLGAYRRLVMADAMDRYAALRW